MGGIQFFRTYPLLKAKLESVLVESIQKPRLLIVDDSTANIHFLSTTLAAEYEVHVAINGVDAVRLAKACTPALILLDIEMPGMSGHDLCIVLKEEPETRGIPIIFVTARDQESDEVFGLNLGAVDYITRPFSVPIVKARIKAQIERQVVAGKEQWGKFNVGEWMVDPNINTLTRGDETRHLRAKAMSLLVLLAKNAGNAVSKDVLIEKIWEGNKYVGEQAIKSTIWSVRQAFDDSTEAPVYIENIPKKGYRLIPVVTWRSDMPPPPVELDNTVEIQDAYPLQVSQTMPQERTQNATQGSQEENIDSTPSEKDNILQKFFRSFLSKNRM